MIRKAVLVLCLVLFQGRIVSGEAGRVSVILVTIDTCRCDALGCYGNPRARTPTLDFLSKSSRLFIYCRTDVPLTLPAHAGLMTGTSVLDHGVRANAAYILKQPVVTVADVMRRAGYRTAAVIGGYPLKSIFGLNKGFMRYDDDFTDGMIERKAEEVTDRAIQMIDSFKQYDYFLWVHYFDPHEPYVPPIKENSELQIRYQNEVDYVDRELRRLLLSAIGDDFKKNIVYIIAGDHGEDLWEHGEPQHGFLLYDTCLRVPLIIGKTDRSETGRAASRAVMLSDVGRALIDLFGNGEVVPDFQSIIKSKYLKGSDEIYLESVFPFERYGWAPVYGYLTRHWIWMMSGKQKLYNIIDDPGQICDIGHENPLLMYEKKTAFESALEMRKKSEKAVLSRETIERLKSLGYSRRHFAYDEMNGKGYGPSTFEMTPYIGRIENAADLVERGNYDKAESILSGIINVDPRNPVVRNNLGLIAFKKKDFQRALDHFNAAIDSDSDNARYLNNLGRTLAALKKTRKAESAYLKAVKNDPEFAPAYINLIILLERQKLFHEAKTYRKKVEAMGSPWRDILADACLTMEGTVD